MKFSVYRFALVGRNGRIQPAKAYRQSEMSELYREGVKLAAAGDMLQVWSARDNGDLLRYDEKRTRTLTDKIVTARSK